MSNWDNFAPWDSNDNNQNNNTFDMQFNDIKKNLTHTYARDDINDKLNQRGYTPCAFPRNVNDNTSPKNNVNNSNNVNSRNNTNNNSNMNNNFNDGYDKFYGRLNSESSLRKMINNNEEKNQITEHQFFNNRGDFKYNAPPNSVSSRNFNSKKSNEINEGKNKNINHDSMNNANTT